MSRPVPAALLLTTLLLAPAAAATFGTQVRPGDSDYTNLTDRASLAVSVNEADLGQVGAVHDNCLLLDTATTAAAGAHRDDIRLTACAGKAAGTQLADNDTIERTAAYPIVAGAVVRYADADGSAKYDKGDPVYLTTAAAGLVASSGTGVWTVRLTPVMGFAAGTFVNAGDADLTAYRTIAANLASSITRLENKAWYLIPSAAGTARDGLLRQDAIRLAGPTGGKADLKVTGLTMAPEKPVAGQAFTITYDVENKGKGAGSAVIGARLNGALVDARGTPAMDPGAKVTLAATLVAPLAANATLEVGDQRRDVAFLPAGALAAPGAGGDLDERVSQLEADMRGLLIEMRFARDDLSALKAVEGQTALATTSVGTAGEADPQALEAPSGKPVPGAGVLLALVALAAVAALARRRQD